MKESSNQHLAKKKGGEKRKRKRNRAKRNAEAAINNGEISRKAANMAASGVIA